MGAAIVFIAVGGSIRLAMAGDAEARFACGDACADGVPLGGLDGRGGTDSFVDPRIGS